MNITLFITLLSICCLGAIAINKKTPKKVRVILTVIAVVLALYLFGYALGKAYYYFIH